jgi:tetratricopeptide (TPR) repeat protein
LDDDAIASAEKALSREPGMSRAHNLIGIVRLEQGKLDLAKESLMRADESGEPLAKFNLATVYIRQQAFEQAVAALERMMEERPDFKQSHRRLAWVLATATDDVVRDGSRAVQLLEQDFQIRDSSNPYGWDAYAAALAEVGQFQSAINAAGRALELGLEQKDANLSAAIEHRLDGYKAGQPHRERGLDQDGVPDREAKRASIN